MFTGEIYEEIDDNFSEMKWKKEFFTTKLFEGILCNGEKNNLLEVL